MVLKGFKNVNICNELFFFKRCAGSLITAMVCANKLILCKDIKKWFPTKSLILQKYVTKSNMSPGNKGKALQAYHRCEYTWPTYHV